MKPIKEIKPAILLDILRYKKLMDKTDKNK